jgi:hypothetical protein
MSHAIDAAVFGFLLGREPIFQNCVLTGMGRQALIAIYVLAMAVFIVGVDFAFLRGLFWQRLLVNVAIVLASAAFYLLFLRHLKS